MISPADAALYRENGYVVQYDFLEPELIEEMRQACDALCAEASALTENNDYYDLEDSHSREDVRVRRLKRPTEMDSVFHRAARHPKLLDALSALIRSEEHTSELQSLMRTSYAVFCLKKKTSHTYTISEQYT